MEQARINALAAKYRDTLLDNIVPFWLKHGLDREFGGIMTAVDRDGSNIDTDKGVWQQGRFAWLMGKLYNTVEPRAQWLDACRSSVEFLETHCFDPADGRMWFHVTREGKPIRKRRYAFSEAFAAIAFGEYAKATGDERYAKLARKAAAAFVNHKPAPKFTDVRPTRGIGGPMITINVCQELRDSINLPEADEWIDQAIADIRQYHIKPDLQCVMETVGSKGEVLDHFDGRTLNPGHAIEGAWFILHEAMHRNDQSLIDTGTQMLDWMWQRGWDREHGGILYFTDLYGKPVQEYWHDMKFWWPQNETVIATLLAYVATGDQKYAQWHEMIDAWAFDKFTDPVHGEWFGYLHRDGSLSTPLKGNLWKGPFHLPRMLLYCWKLLEKTQE